MSNDINNNEVESTQPQTQETTVNKTRKDAREVIRTHIIDAVTDLGGKAQGEPIKAWILNKVGAEIEDFGRTPTNKKYPNGRHVFVECYTHIQRDFKKKGLLFTPAWGWVSLTEGDAVEVEGKALSKPKKTAESTCKVLSEETEVLSVEPQEEEAVIEVESEATEVEMTPVEAQEPDTTTLSADEYVLDQEEETVEVVQEEETATYPLPTVLERVLELTEDHDVHVDNKAVIEAWVDVAKKELVEDIGKTKPYRKALSEVEEGYILSIGDVREEEIILSTEDVEVEATADEYVLEDQTNADEYVLEDQTPDTDVVQDYSLDDLFDDDFLDGDEEGETKRQSLDLKAVEGGVWGEIKEGFIYLADNPNPTTVLKFKEELKDETEGKSQARKEKHSLALQQISSKGLPTYVKILKNASKKMKQNFEEGDERFATHNQEVFHGCFGNIKTDKTLCSLSCPISQLCTNASVVEL